MKTRKNFIFTFILIFSVLLFTILAGCENEPNNNTGSGTYTDPEIPLPDVPDPDVSVPDVDVTGVSLSQTDLVLAVGEYEILIAAVSPGDATNKAVTWASSDTAVATVANGTVIARSKGTATVTVTTEDGDETAECTVTVGLVGMVWIPAGIFQMGSPETEPNRQTNETQHEVTLTKGFYMGKYPVTQAQYEAVMETNPSLLKTAVPPEFNTANRPVENVNSWDAIVFCNKLSMEEGLSPAYLYTNGATISTDPAVGWGNVPTALAAALQWLSRISVVEDSTGYRLPTEAQWEYACRAEKNTAYNTGETISYSTGWYASNSGNRTHEVGAKPPNAWGLYDMHGNVSEWCWDRTGNTPSDYTDAPAEDPTGPTSGNNRVTRGGSWQTSGGELRSAYRGSVTTFTRNNTTGFRLIRPINTVNIEGDE